MYKIYTKPNCPFCFKAKHLLERLGLPYTELVVGVDVGRDELLTQFPNVRTVPIILEGPNFVGGYTELVERLNPTEQLLTE